MFRLSAVSIMLPLPSRLVRLLYGNGRIAVFFFLPSCRLLRVLSPNTTCFFLHPTYRLVLGPSRDLLSPLHLFVLMRYLASAPFLSHCFDTTKNKDHPSNPQPRHRVKAPAPPPVSSVRGHPLLPVSCAVTPPSFHYHAAKQLESTLHEHRRLLTPVHLAFIRVLLPGVEPPATLASLARYLFVLSA